MDSLETIFLLLFAAVLLVGIARKYRIPYPIALVLGGAAMGFMPFLHPINFDPNLLLVIILPPILYYAAFGISFREFKQGWRDIFSLALGLVVATTLFIAVIFKWMFPELPWAMAFAFGAIISPPDATAATTILKRFSIGSRLATLLEGESLVNDASALVLYKLAVAALLTGSFSFIEGSMEFAKVVIGGIIVGLISGFALQLFSRRYLEPVVGVVFSFTIPYITFLAANSIGASGVLAVVVNGLIGSRILLAHHSSLRRVLGYAAWDIFIILLNCFVFILIGLQLRVISTVLSAKQMLSYVGYALMISLAMVIIRMIWVLAKNSVPYFKAINKPKSSVICPQIMQNALVVGWAGMRGIVSLAAALALPLALPNGAPLEGRNEIIFITFTVILITLLVPGLTMPYLLHLLKVHSHSESSDAKKIRDQLAAIAEAKLHYFLVSKMINEEEFNFLNSYFRAQPHVLEMAHASENELKSTELARLKVIMEQRKQLLELWKQGEIDDRLLTHLENELDIVEIHIARAEF